MDMAFNIAVSPAQKAGDDLSAYVYRIEHHPSFGRLTHIRMFAGKLGVRDEISLNPRGNQLIANKNPREQTVNEKITQNKLIILVLHFIIIL